MFLLMMIVCVSLAGISAGTQSSPGQSGVEGSSEVSVDWDPQYFHNCGILRDGFQKAQLCYQRYEQDALSADENYCCPNWRLADCLINNVGPACDADTQNDLVTYWRVFFQGHNDCRSFQSYLDGSMPARCSWYYHKGMILGWTFGAIALGLAVVAVAYGLVAWRRKKRNDSILTNESITNS